MRGGPKKVDQIICLKCKLAVLAKKSQISLLRASCAS